MKVDFNEIGFFDESGFDELVFYRKHIGAGQTFCHFAEQLLVSHRILQRAEVFHWTFFRNFPESRE